MRSIYSSTLTALYVYTRSGQAVKRKEGPGQTVKSGFRAESSGQDRFQAVKNLDPGRGRSYGKYWSNRPLNYKRLTYVGGSRPIAVSRPDKISFSSQSDERQPLIS